MVSAVRVHGSAAARVAPGLVAGGGATLSTRERRAARDKIRRALFRNPAGLTTEQIATVAGLDAMADRPIILGWLRGKGLRAKVVQVFTRAPLAVCGAREPWTVNGRPGGRRSVWFHVAHAAHAIERAYKETPPGQWNLQTSDVVRLATGGT